jgi:signal transduction histidine kinase/ligand-binding sensor domain-containing protein/DNA-binding response OmpR family regulator
MRKFLLFLFLSFVAIHLKAFNNNYFFERISPESGFAFDAVYTIVEDCNGLVWFGCNNGLYHYNTHEIEKILFYPNNSPTPQAVKVNKIIKDEQCRMWICTEVGLYSLLPNENNIVQIHFSTKDLNIANQSVEDILQLSTDTYLIVINKTLFLYNLQDKSFVEVRNNQYHIRERVSFLGKGMNDEILIGTTRGQVFRTLKGRIPELIQLYTDAEILVKSICISGDHYLVGYDGLGVKTIDSYGNLIHTYSEEKSDEYHLPSNRVRQIIKMTNGQIWIGTYGGILVISPGNRKIIKNDGINGLPYNSIYVLYQGNNEGIWIGTWAGGIAYFNDYNYRFHHVKRTGKERTGDRSVASSFVEDENQNILIGSEDGGISVYNPFNNTFDFPIPEKLQRIKSLHTNDGRNIFIGTFDRGYWLLNMKTLSVKNINLGTYSNDIIYSSSTQIENELWIASRGAQGLINYNLESSKITQISLSTIFPEYPLANWVWKIFRDSNNTLWICTDNGLFTRSSVTGEFNACFKNDSIYGLGTNIIYTISKDNNGVIWVGTKGKGLFTYDEVSSEVRPFIHNNMIATTDVYGILCDDNNNIWFSTNMGIYYYNSNTEILQRFSSVDGLSGEQFIPNAALKSSDGKLYFGSANGFNIIDPDLIRLNPIPPSVFLTKLLVNNHPYEITAGEKANKFYLPGIKELKLKHNSNSLTFGFSSKSFIKPSRNKLKYRLENYMNDWNIIENGRDIAFTKIRPGSYTLEVLGSNNDGVWSDAPIKLPIRIYPPIWLSTYAYLVYILFAGTIFFLIFKESRTRLKMRKDFMSERFKNEANQTIHDEKIKFFTNISHEFRTPLTLIISPINNLLNKFQYDLTTAKQLKVIKRNAERLSRLTNQILDFRMLEAGQIQVKPRKVDIVEICNGIIDCFEFQITEKKINFIFTSDYKAIWVMLDPEMIEKIIYNLLSNSFKFSPEKGQILFSIEKKELTTDDYKNCIYTGSEFLGETLEIKVRDFGVGIPPEILPTIFDRFTKAPDNNRVGSGIGLHMCQEYARLNQANIMVHSEPKKGSTFILNIPYKKCSWNKKESFIIQPHFDKIEQNEAIKPDSSSKIDNDTVILIVEDNDDLRIYLKNFLSNFYRVLTAKNGNQGLEIALEVIPSIVITDIMMPGIDGIELTAAIKSNRKTHFIPVIILTALSEDRYQMQGLLKGADSFLVKPIDESILMVQIQNILKTRQSLKKMFDQNNENAKNIKVPSQLSFIDHAEQIILENLQKTEFNISDLANQLNTSHSSLHRKIKSHVNQSPTEFIRDIRLKMAIKLMKDNKYNIDEISNYVGFNSTSYFMRSFKKKYGKTPKEYRRDQNHSMLE